jgi:hypothetical protein
LVVRRWVALVLAAASATDCGATGTESNSSDPHPPRTDDERFLAARYGSFVRALERNDADGICRPLAPRLAESYKCGASSELRIPRELRGIEVPLTEVFAAADPSVPEVIQISARSRRRDGGSLILFFGRRGSNEWRVTKTIIGSYG